MLIDHAKIYVKGGDGGNGMVSFHREKYVTNGGPDGGDGGKGGDVIFYACEDLSTLQNFRFKRRFIADDGGKGLFRRMYGRGAVDMRVAVPVGTLITEVETGRMIADLTEAGQEVIVAKGGRGGQGNMHFANSVRQAPNFARAGIPGEEWELSVELKLLADVGLIGFPNVGKSTLLSVISAARPKIADYHFTTIEPNLGVVSVDDVSFVVADIPGIIEGAHEGAGLGHDFLRHIERTRLLIHVVDVSGSEGRSPIDDVDRLNMELNLFNPLLETRPQIIAANKIDLAKEEDIAVFMAEMKRREYEVFPISAAIADGTKELMNAVAAKLITLPKTILLKEAKEETLYKFEAEELFKVEAENDTYSVVGLWIKNLVDSTNFDDSDSLQYFQRIIRKKGVIDALKKAGVKEGDLVRMYELEFEYIE
jgi:GTP-binding protein